MFTRCTYSQCMPHVHLNDLWTNTCGLGMARAYGTVIHACATKFKKCEKEGKVYILRWKSLRRWVQFQTTHNTRIWSFLKMTMCIICFARSCCILDGDFMALWLYLHSLSSLPFSRQAPSLFYLTPITFFVILTSQQLKRPLAPLQHWEQ